MTFTSSFPFPFPTSIPTSKSQLHFSAKYEYIVILNASVGTLLKSLFCKPIVGRLTRLGYGMATFMRFPRPRTSKTHSIPAKYNYIVILNASVGTLLKSLFRKPFAAQLTQPDQTNQNMPHHQRNFLP